MDLLLSFNIFSQEHCHLTPNTKVLLAVSGGMDSMVMCDLFMEAGYTFSAAHCNFRLRGAESDADEVFIKSFCREHEIPCFTMQFDTLSYVAEHKLSIQEAARKLRYEWFESLRFESGFDFVATAHHQNDVVETMLINISRGTGIAGLHGIRAHKDRLIRPMLFATREQIGSYAKTNGISYRDDASNDEDHYARNKIRHHVIPVLKEINPALEMHVVELTRRISFAEDLLTRHITETWDLIAKKTGNGYHLSIDGIRHFEHTEQYLFEWLRPFGFNASQAHDIAAGLHAQSGTRFDSPTHTLTKDRTYLLLEARVADVPAEIFRIGPDTTEAHAGNCAFGFAVVSPASPFSPGTQVVDHDKLRFPLTLRRWQDGDRFMPLGMKGFKKISDLLIDSKVPVPEKQQVFVVLSGDDVVCVVGHRIDDRYKITPGTQQAFTIMCKK